MHKLTAHDAETQSLDLVADNIAKLGALFPEILTEGADGGKRLDLEALRELLGDAVEDKEERYNFTWYGKAQARRLAQTPSTGTLRPCPAESKQWDSTQNLFIEGDNLEVLKLLQKSYHQRVKMIYIDPPYNTGKDFIYPDNYRDNIGNYLELTGQVEDGRKMGTNTETSGRYHTNWLNMMYPRLKLARNLLREDGVIFISIGNAEVANLRKLCDEIFGEENMLCLFAWRTDGNFDNQAKFKFCHEYIIAYAKQEAAFQAPLVVDPSTPEDSKIFRPEIRNTIVKNGRKNPPSEIILPIGFPAAFECGLISPRTDLWPNIYGAVNVKDGKLTHSVKVYSGWSSKELLEEFISNKCQEVFDSKGQATVFEITATGAIEAVKVRGEPSHVVSVLTGFGGPQKATADLLELGVPFDDYPKPAGLIKYFSSMVRGKDFIAVDFFSGSATTANAIIQLNAEDGGNRSFIMVQLPEQFSENTEAFKAGYKTISEIGKERIRRAGEKILADNAGKDGIDKLDVGFKVFKLDSTNIKPWDVDFDQLESKLPLFADSLKDDRSAEDVLYEILLKYGLDLSLPITTHTLAGKTVYNIGMGALAVCLDQAITLDTVEGIAKLKDELQPETAMRVVFRDSGFADDVVKVNAVQILKQAGIEDVRSV